MINEPNLIIEIIEELNKIIKQELQVVITLLMK